MKKTLTLAGLGMCALLVFPSCKSTDKDGFAGYQDSFEEALPMNYVDDDTIPPWLLADDTNSPQVSAGETTILPPPDETLAAETGRSVSGKQNQPIAENDVIIDSSNDSYDPFAGTESATVPAPVVTTTQAAPDKPVIKTTTPKPSVTKPVVKGGKTGTKINRPTMIVYKVRKGDNLTDIAKRSRTTVAQIRKDSGIKGDLIRPGQIIKVRYTPQNYKPEKAATGKKGQKNGTKGAVKPAAGKTYVMRRGDTLSAIAKKNGVTTADILKANNLKASDAAKLPAGKKLIIPKR